MNSTTCFAALMNSGKGQPFDNRPLRIPTICPMTCRQDQLYRHMAVASERDVDPIE
jgi:hypothetical protein